MNRILIGTILACGLLLLESPKAAAHDERGGQYRPPTSKHAHQYRREYGARHSREYYSRQAYRGGRHDHAKKMPKWLKHDPLFRRWLVLTGLERNRNLTWNQLFDIYLWEQSYLPRYRGY